MKRIIWSSDINIKDFKEYLDEYATDVQGESLSDDEKYGIIASLNDMYLEDERINLSINTNTIINIADLGLWNGRKSVYKVEGHNIKDILSTECDSIEWYCDRYNMRATAKHHDGTNHYLYRELKDERDLYIVIEHLYNNTLTPRLMSKYTKSLLPRIKEVYGW